MIVEATMFVATRPANGITLNAGHPEVLQYFKKPILFTDAAEAKAFAQKIGADDGFDLKPATKKEIAKGINSSEVSI
jgi:hypothetical protein